MRWARPSRVDERREAGLALADALLAGARPLSPLPDAAHARVKRRLEASARRRPLRRGRWWQPALIAGLLLGCGAAFGIALERLVLRSPSAHPALPPTSGTVGPSHGRAGRGKVTAPSSKVEHAPAADVREVEPTTGPATSDLAPTVGPRAPTNARKLATRVEPTSRLPPSAPLAFPAPDPAATVSAGPAAPSVAGTPPVGLPPSAPRVQAASPARPDGVPPSSDGMTEESLLAVAVRALRSQGDPRAALAALDEYRSRYSFGRLQVEAEVLRVDALLAQKRPGEALRVLDGLDMSRLPGGNGRQLQRAELRASAGRWSEAQADFDQVLMRARPRDRDLAERALWGRAQSRARQGDAAGASADAKAYLHRFPNGRFAVEAARLDQSGDP